MSEHKCDKCGEPATINIQDAQTIYEWNEETDNWDEIMSEGPFEQNELLCDKHYKSR